MLSIFEWIAPAIIIGLISLPLIPVFQKKTTVRSAKFRIYAQIGMFFGVFLAIALLQMNSALTVFAEGSATTTSPITGTLAQGLGFVAAALVTSASAIGAGIAVAAAAPAAIGAISENKDNFANAIIFVALAEGVAIYGLLISILIIGKLG